MSVVIDRQWSDVRPGDFVVDPAGTTWKLEKRGILGEIHLIDQAGNRAELGRMSGPVRLWDVSPEAEALEGFRVALGARVVYDRH